MCKVDEDINTIKKKNALLQAISEGGLEGNTKKTKYMFVSVHQNAG
jgi:hypothetical protein